MADLVEAPFTVEQVESLNEYQYAGVFHEFTCGNDSTHTPLFATEQGWVCCDCGYTQTWCHGWMADGSWRKSPLYTRNQT